MNQNLSAEPCSLRVISWNVNGLNSVGLDAFLDRLKDKVPWNILLLQELSPSFPNRSRVNGHMMITSPAHWRKVGLIINRNVEQFIRISSKPSDIFPFCTLSLPANQSNVTLTFMSAYPPHSGHGLDL